MILDRVQGYACVFGVWSKPVDDGAGQFIEMIERDGFDLLCSGNVTADVLHSKNTLFAGTSDGSLRLWQDRHGLAFEGDLPADMRGAGIRDMMMARGPMAASFGIVDPVAQWSRHDGMSARIISRLMLDHVTLADQGAYPTSTWLASMPADRMPPHIAAEAQRWRVGRIIAEQAAKAKADRRLAPRTAEKRRGEPIPEAVLARIQNFTSRCTGRVTL